MTTTFSTISGIVPLSSEPTMPKKLKADAIEGFGPRLAQLRKDAGFTQTELADELGISQRMVAYYESPGAQPPANLLPHLARLLGSSLDALLGQTPPKRRLAKQEGDTRLRRRLSQLEKLDTGQRRQILQLLDTFIERDQLKRKAQQRQAA